MGSFKPAALTSLAPWVFNARPGASLFLALLALKARYDVACLMERHSRFTPTGPVRC